MGFNYVVLGAGRQGVAAAYDLAKNGQADRITLADLDSEITRQAILRLETLLPKASCQYAGVICDASKPAEVAMTITGADVIISAVPFRFNATVTEAAIAAQASFCDLGGNTQVVQQQFKRHERAAAADVSIVPDCGLAPGLGNILAAHGIAEMDEPQEVHIRCGGLPEKPIGPLGYKLVFNFDGLINEYSGHGQFLRDGQRIDIPTLTEVEAIEFPAPLGRCEAAVTSGGISTCAETFEGRLESCDYKTVRYPGHFAAIRAMFELGCFDEHVILPDGTTLEPRALLRQLLEYRLALPEVRDLVVLRCTVSGRHNGQRCTRRYDLLDRHDEQTGFSAMERMTAFPAALVAYMQARGLIEPGARPLEVAIPARQYFDELGRHDVHVEVTTEV
ncbi:MAG: saccharopine dehydrogenase NADP-binding domain-containing protein [Phycisphaerae bacterium]|nr:saccharopine dehydrogenase NADP-binding domain-containing protein [Phycisphaerae bacterium]